MKRIFLLFVLGIVLVSVTGCNGSGGGSGSNSENPQDENPETPGQADTQAPSVPAKPEIRATGSGSSGEPSAQIIWQASTDNKGVKTYRIYRNGAFLAESSLTEFTDTGISAAGRYCYSILAIDEAGNESALSESVCFDKEPAGKIRWKFSIEGSSADRINASPQLDSKGNVYFSDKKYIYCVRNDGSLYWKVSMDDFGNDSGRTVFDDADDQSDDISDVMAIGSDDSIYILHGDYLNALSPEGSLKWKIPVNDDGIQGIMDCDGRRLSAGHNGKVYFFSDRFLNALNPDGSIRWQKERKENLPSSIYISPDDSVCFVDDTSLAALNPDGSVKWRHGDKYPVIRGVSDDGTVYCSYIYDSLTALTPEGTEKWEISLDDYGSLDSGYVSKINHDGTVYFSLVYTVTMPPPVGFYKYRKFYAYSVDGVLMWSRNDFDPGSADLIKDHGIYIKTGTGFDRYNPWDGNLRSHYENILSGFTEDADGNAFVYYSVKGQSLPENLTYLKALNPDGSAKWEVPVLTANGEDTTFFKPLIGNDGTVYAVSHKKNGNMTEYSVNAVYSDSRGVNF